MVSFRHATHGAVNKGNQLEKEAEVGSGCRRGTILDRGENGRTQNESPLEARRASVCRFERKIEERRNDERRERRLNDMPLQRSVIAAEADVDFSRIARCDQVVGHGDSRQQNQDHECERNELGPAIFSGARHSPQPENDHPRGQYNPAEIEKQFHDCC